MMNNKSLARLTENIRKRNPRMVFLQAPEGLKTKVQGIADMIEKSCKCSVLISNDPCYGACDLQDGKAKLLGCDLLVHMGHTPMKLKRNTVVPVLFEEYMIEIDPVPFLKRHLKLLRPCKKCCLVTTAQYISGIEPARKFLEANGKKVYVGQPSVAKYPGQVLGCDYSAAEPFDRLVDCFIYLGTGRFHPIGLAMKVNKPVLVVDYELNTLENMHRERDMLKRIRMVQIEKAKESKNFGILVSAKPGQENIGIAKKVQKKLRKKGKNAWILVMDEIVPEKLLGMKLDVLVNCACPRLTEDFRQFKKPILDPEEVNQI
jgi:2-(3-amino-3-carboxypropyl)histidine synthase